MNIDSVRQDTPGTRNGIHLLACGSALMPQPVIDAIVEHMQLEASIGGYEAHAKQAESLDAVYTKVASHLGAAPEEIAITENATMAWCHAFYALPLARGSRVLTCEAEYAANYVALLQRARRDDFQIEVIPSDDTGAIDLQVLKTSLEKGNVSLIAMTWIPTNGGLVNPAHAVGELAQSAGVPFLLDACQAVGQMPVDVNTLQCDFLSATARKFLRGPRGIGFLYVRNKWLQSLEPAIIDHFAAPWTSRDDYTLRDDARRFENWENSYALRAGLGAAIDYADGLGIESIHQRVQALASHTRSALSAHTQISLKDLGAEQCGIISFTVNRDDPSELVLALRKEGISIGASIPSSTLLDSERRQLPTLLRIAPHYYNTQEEIDHCVDRLIKLLG